MADLSVQLLAYAITGALAEGEASYTSLRRIKRNGIRAKDEDGFAVGDGLGEFIPIVFGHGYFVFNCGVKMSVFLRVKYIFFDFFVL
jgi:hypothetical protein